MSRRIAPSTSVDNLKREAKRWHKALGAGDRSAAERLAAALPGTPSDLTLRHVQLALAREFGLAGWNELTAAVEAARQVSAESSAVLTELLSASSTGDAATVARVLDADRALVNFRGTLHGHSGLRTALHFAINGPHEDVVRLLLDHGADANIRDEGDNAFPLHFAAEKNHFAIIRMLIEHGADPIGIGDMHELEVIGWATVFGHADSDVVDYLLAHGARHNVSSAVVMGNFVALRTLIAADRTLLERPMDRANRQRRPLHLAVVKRQLSSLVALLELGADPSARDSAALTALDQAALDGQAAMVDALIAHGAVIEFPAALALDRGDDIERLLAAEPAMLHPGARLGTLIIRAAERGSAATIETLIRAGADVNVEDSQSLAVDGTEGYTALHAAAFHGNLEAARVLLAYGASVTARDSSYSGSPAGWAAFAGHEAVRDLILVAPIDIFDAIEFDRRDRIRELAASDPAVLERPFGSYLRGSPRFPDSQAASWTPLDLAVARNKTATVALLRELEIDRRAPLINRFLENACPDHHVRGASAHVLARHTAMRLLDQHPWLGTATLATRVACGDVDGVHALLDADPSLINASAPSSRGSAGTPEDLDRDLAAKTWAPLLFCCFTRLPLATTNDNAVAMATLLLDRGADPNAFFMAGDSRYTPLVGVIGEGEEDRPPHPQRDELVALLLDRGAESYDQQVGYNIGLRGDVLWFLRAIHARSLAMGRAADWADPEWQMINMGNYGFGARWYLTIAIERNDSDLATWCLEHEASPNAAPARAGGLRRQRPLYELAVRGARHEIAALLRRYGADQVDVVLTPAEQLAGAALRGDFAAVQQVIRHDPVLRRDATAMETLVRADRADAVALLLDAGVSTEVENADGERPLHIAAWSNALEVAQLLIDRGAEVDSIRGNYHNSALGAAGYFRFEAMIDLLARYSRDFWELVYVGRIARVRELLRDEPELARSTRNEETPLMWLPVDDESRATELAELLIGLGADAAQRGRDGRTAADKAERMGMTRLADRLESATAPRG